MNINWEQKLSSRKFWAAVVGFVTAICAAFGIPNMTTEQVAAVITAGATLVIYILSEGAVDAARIKNNQANESESDKDENN